MDFRSFVCTCSSVSFNASRLLDSFSFLFAFRLLISVDDILYVAVYLLQMCSAALVDYNRGDCGSNFCIIFLRLRYV
jgi:hypothetical protein